MSPHSPGYKPPALLLSLEVSQETLILPGPMKTFLGKVCLDLKGGPGHCGLPSSLWPVHCKCLQRGQMRPVPLPSSRLSLTPCLFTGASWSHCPESLMLKEVTDLQCLQRSESLPTFTVSHWPSLSSVRKPSLVSMATPSALHCHHDALLSLLHLQSVVLCLSHWHAS